MPKKPFSGKAKKAQLQAKRERKAADADNGGGENNVLTHPLRLLRKFKNDPEEDNDADRAISDDSKQNKGSKYRLKFKTESKREIAENREKAQQPIQSVSDLTSNSEMFFDSYHDFPRRQDWSDDWSKDRLERSEQKYFREYVDKIMENTEDDENGKEYSYFELNLETWRQLWRVIEMSDIILMILDVRYATAVFPPSLYDYIVKEKQKHFILVLNKCDLIEPELCVAWKKYFNDKFPELHVVFFTSFPSYNSMIVRRHGIKMKRLRANFRMAKEGALQIHKICQNLSNLDLTSWKNKIIGDVTANEEVSEDKFDDQSSFLTLGTIGHPNVGKSSLLNSLLGKKRVSVSKTPGHTKHFQTLFLTNNVRLCDCPGLVFPSKVPKPLQVLMGSFPIAQVREPYSVVNFLAERINLPSLLKLEMEKGQKFWSSFLICSSWAEFRRFFTSRTSRPDAFRAANEIMRMALEGKLCLVFHPPQYEKDNFVSNPETAFVREVLGDDFENIIEDVDDDSNGSSNEDAKDNKENDSETEDIVKTKNPFSALEDCDLNT